MECPRPTLQMRKADARKMKSVSLFLTHFAISRRLFCKGIAASPFLPVMTTLGTIGCAAVPVYHGALVDGRIEVLRKELERKHNENKVFVVQISELEYPILIVQQRVNEYHALSIRCTHQGCHVRPSRKSFVCPCHGSTFDLEGRVIHGPAKAPLQRFEVEVTADGIEVIVPGTRSN